MANSFKISQMGANLSLSHRIYLVALLSKRRRVRMSWKRVPAMVAIHSGLGYGPFLHRLRTFSRPDFVSPKNRRRPIAEWSSIMAISLQETPLCHSPSFVWVSLVFFIAVVMNSLKSSSLPTAPPSCFVPARSKCWPVVFLLSVGHPSSTHPPKGDLKDAADVQGCKCWGRLVRPFIGMLAGRLRPRVAGTNVSLLPLSLPSLSSSSSSSSWLLLALSAYSNSPSSTSSCDKSLALLAQNLPNQCQTSHYQK